MQLPSSQFTFALEMALDYLSNLTGPAEIYINDQQITHCIFVFCLTLFIILIRVQLNILWKWTFFCKHLYFTHSIFQDTSKEFLEYTTSCESAGRSIIQEKVSQQSWQVLPPTDKFITIPDLSRLTLQQKPSLQPTEVKPQSILVPEQD